ncbi:ankyrin repeat domain-containing protein [Francisella opportunistica]|uniref:ankyrin repeat domain-containing protein n=1 Tax=Francisella opportunistica TaxID=2016517 RepID=UPI000E0B541F|nr:ankyrin repeat domain-containing protein [Francisella opportunistica]AXH33462.1 hypothetical protein CGC45_06055 [Francisella opportunistica]
MPKSKYDLLKDNIKDISDKSDWGDYYNKLGLPDGLCFGLAYMWGQANLAGDQETFYDRLDILTKDYSNEVKLSKIVREYTDLQRKNSPYNKSVARYKENLLKDNYDLILSIRAFLDGLLLYHNPSKTYFFSYRINSNLVSQNGYEASKYVINGSLFQKDSTYYDACSLPLLEIYNKSYAGNEKSFVTYLEPLITKLKNPLSKNPYLIIFNTHNHVIACTTQFIFDANYLEVKYLTKNYFYYNEYKQEAELAKRLFESFLPENKNGILAVNVTIFIAPTQIVDFDIMSFKKRLSEHFADKFNIGLKSYYKYNNERLSEEYNNERLSEGYYKYNNEYKNHISKSLNLNSRFNKLNSIIATCKNINELLYIFLEEKNFLSKVIDINQEYTKLVYSLLKQIQSKFISDAEENYKKNLKDMVQKKYHINTFLLFIASEKNHTDVVKLLLLDQRTEVNQATNNGFTPFLVACKNGHIDIVKLLLLDQRIKVNQADNDGTTPFMISCENGYIDIVELLLLDSRTEANQAKNSGIKSLSNNLLLEVSNSIASYFIAGCSNSSNNLILEKLKENFPTHDINTAWKMPIINTVWKIPAYERLTPLVQGCYFMCNRSINWLLDNYNTLNKKAAFKNRNALQWYLTHKGKAGYDNEIERKLRQL